MAKLDRLGWVDGISFLVYGTRFGIRVNDPVVLNKLQEYLPPGWKPSSSPFVNGLYSLVVGNTEQGSKTRRYNLLYKGSGRLARTMNLDEALELMESDLHFEVAISARRRLFVHAGVVAWHGRAIVIPGRSLSGKTSLVEALVRAGATYYSDEYAVFDSRGYVHSYSKPLSVRQEGNQRPKRCPVESIGGHCGSEPLPVGLVIIVQYQSGARWRPRVLSAGQAALALLDNTVLARIRPELALATLQRVLLNAVTLKGKRGEAQDVVRALLKIPDGEINAEFSDGELAFQRLS